jgi:hypothetical protein
MNSKKIGPTASLEKICVEPPFTLERNPTSLQTWADKLRDQITV